MPFVEVPSYTEFDHLKKSKAFRTAFNEAIEVRQQMEALEQRLGELKDELEAELLVAEIEPGTSIDYEGWRVLVVDKPGSKKLDKKKLLTVLKKSLGSEAKAVGVLKQAMVEGKPSHYVQIVSPKDKPEGVSGE